MNLITGQRREFLMRLALFSFLFFIWGFVTVLNLAMSGHLEKIFGLSYAVASLINITFFSSYLIISLSAGTLISRIGYKNSILTGWILLCLGCFLFFYSVKEHEYYYFLVALFVQAAGITTLQVGANLYIVLMGDKRTAAARLTFMQAINALGTFVAPMIAFFVIRKFSHLPDEVRESIPVMDLIEIDAAYLHYPYLYLGIVLSVFAFVIAFSKIPDIATLHMEPLNKITSLRKRHVLHFPQLRLGAFAIFAYVGAEVALAKYIETFATDYSGYYWGTAMVGRFIGAYLLLKTGPRKLVTICASAAGGLVLLSIITPGDFSLWCVVLIGLFNSVLFPCIFSLGVNGLGRFSLDGSAVLIMFIVGGAVIPFNVLNYSYISYKIAFVIPLMCYIYIAVYGRVLSQFEIRDDLNV